MGHGCFYGKIPAMASASAGIMIAKKTRKRYIITARKYHDCANACGIPMAYSRIFPGKFCRSSCLRQARTDCNIWKVSRKRWQQFFFCQFVQFYFLNVLHGRTSKINGQILFYVICAGNKSDAADSFACYDHSIRRYSDRQGKMPISAFAPTGIYSFGVISVERRAENSR